MRDLGGNFLVALISLEPYHDPRLDSHLQYLVGRISRESSGLQISNAEEGSVLRNLRTSIDRGLD